MNSLEEVVQAMRACAVRTKSLARVQIQYASQGIYVPAKDEFELYLSKFEDGVNNESATVLTPAEAVAFFAAPNATPIAAPPAADVVCRPGQQIDAEIERSGVLSVRVDAEESSSYAGDGLVTQRTKVRELNREWLAVEVADAADAPESTVLAIDGHRVQADLARVDFVDGDPSVAYFSLTLVE